MTSKPQLSPKRPEYPFTHRTLLDPPAEFARARAEAPVMRVSLWNGGEAWLVTRLKDVQQVLSDARISADATAPGFPLLSERDSVTQMTLHFARMDNPEHATFRRLLSPYFTVKKAEDMRPEVAVISDGLIDEITALAPPVDLVTTYSQAIPWLVFSRILGVPLADREFFEGLLRIRTDTRASADKVDEANREIAAYIDRIARDKRTDPGDDVLSRLVEHEQAGEIAHSDVIGIANLLLIAGNNTTRNQIALGALMLVIRPDLLARVREDASLYRPMVTELLRYFSIVQNQVQRVALEDVEIGGQLIKAGDGVIAMIASANRDENHYQAPDSFDLDRGARDHLAFGYGIHACLGRPLAQMQLEVALERLFTRLPNLRLATNLDDIPFVDGHAMTYGLKDLNVQW